MDGEETERDRDADNRVKEQDGVWTNTVNGASVDFERALLRPGYAGERGHLLALGSRSMGEFVMSLACPLASFTVEAWTHACMLSMPSPLLSSLALRVVGWLFLLPAFAAC